MERGMFLGPRIVGFTNEETKQSVVCCQSLTVMVVIVFVIVMTFVFKRTNKKLQVQWEVHLGYQFNDTKLQRNLPRLHPKTVVDL